MPAREVERVSDASPLALLLACHVGAAQTDWERDACEWAAAIRNGDADRRALLENRLAAGAMYDAFAGRVFALLWERVGA